VNAEYPLASGGRKFYGKGLRPHLKRKRSTKIAEEKKPLKKSKNLGKNKKKNERKEKGPPTVQLGRLQRREKPSSRRALKEKERNFAQGKNDDNYGSIRALCQRENQKKKSPTEDYGKKNARQKGTPGEKKTPVKKNEEGSFGRMDARVLNGKNEGKQGAATKKKD